MIFVRHARAVVDPERPTEEWPLDPAHVGDVARLRVALPDLPVVCSDMLRAVETARLIGEPTVEPRLAEVSQPWTDDLEGCLVRYFAGERIAGWEAQDAARARLQSVVDEHGEAIYVSHGTLLTLYLASARPTVDAMEFWAALASPSAWQVAADRLVHLF